VFQFFKLLEKIWVKKNIFKNHRFICILSF
jgi:hypothetical protein